MGRKSSRKGEQRVPPGVGESFCLRCGGQGGAGGKVKVSRGPKEVRNSSARRSRGPDSGSNDFYAAVTVSLAASTCVCVCVCGYVCAQWHPALCDPLDCGPPGSTALNMEWWPCPPSRTKAPREQAFPVYFVYGHVPVPKTELWASLLSELIMITIAITDRGTLHRFICCCCSVAKSCSTL